MTTVKDLDNFYDVCDLDVLLDTLLNKISEDKLSDYDQVKLQGYFNDILASPSKYLSKKHEILNEIAQLRNVGVVKTSKPVSPNMVGHVDGNTVSAHNALFAIMNAIPFDYGNRRTGGEILNKLVEFCGIRTTDELGKIGTMLIQAVGPLKASLGKFDDGIIMTSEQGKHLLSRMAVKTKTYVTKSSLPTKLLQYKFSFFVDDKISGIAVPVESASLADLKGMALVVKVRCGNEVLVLHMDQTVRIEGNIYEFIAAWNANMSNDEIVYVDITDGVVKDADIALGIYDFEYVQKTKNWNVSRAEIVKTTQYSEIDDKDWIAMDVFMGAVSAHMSNFPYNPHFLDQYNTYLMSFNYIISKTLMFSDKLRKQLATSGRQLAGVWASSSQVLFNKMMTGSMTIEVAVTKTNAVRNERGKFRNKGFREVLSKNAMDPLYPFLPAPICTARKFVDIMVKNKDIYASNCDVYGCARMRFFSALSREHFIGAPGERNYFDNNNAFLGNNVGVDVQNGDFYSIGDNTGKGKSLIDDVSSAPAVENIVNYNVPDGVPVPVKFKNGCFTHKIRIATKAAYDNCVLKIMMDKIKTPDPAKEVSGGWLLPLTMYRRIEFDIPGKLQSSEFFIYCNGYTGVVDISKMARLKQLWQVFVLRKCGIMCYSGAIMDGITITGKQFRNKVFNEEVLRLALPATLAGGDVSGLVRNGLSLKTRMVGVAIGNRLLYEPFFSVGKTYVPVDNEGKTALTMDILDLDFGVERINK